MTRHHICPKHGKEVCEQPEGLDFPARIYHSCVQGFILGNYTKSGKPLRTPKGSVIAGR